MPAAQFRSFDYRVIGNMQCCKRIRPTIFLHSGDWSFCGPASRSRAGLEAENAFYRSFHRAGFVCAFLLYGLDNLGKVIFHQLTHCVDVTAFECVQKLLVNFDIFYGVVPDREAFELRLDLMLLIC